MDQQKGRKILYIVLFIAVLLVGIWTVIDLLLDKEAPTPMPTATENAENVTPMPTLPPSALPSDRAQAIDFSLENLEGDTVALSDMQGKVTVVNFWYAGCGWCMYEMPEFAEMVAHYADQDVAFLFVNSGDDADTAKRAMDQNGIPGSMVMMDFDITVTRLYQIQGFPTTVIVDKQGGIAETFVGASTKDEVMPVVDSLLSE
jgi:peroxiredoxin